MRERSADDRCSPYGGMDISLRSIIEIIKKYKKIRAKLSKMITSLCFVYPPIWLAKLSFVNFI